MYSRPEHHVFFSTWRIVYEEEERLSHAPITSSPTCKDASHTGEDASEASPVHHFRDTLWVPICAVSETFSASQHLSVFSGAPRDLKWERWSAKLASTGTGAQNVVYCSKSKGPLKCARDAAIARSQELVKAVMLPVPEHRHCQKMSHSPPAPSPSDSAISHL